MTTHRFILDIDLDDHETLQSAVDLVYRELGHQWFRSSFQLMDGNYQRLEPTADRRGVQSSGLLVDEIVPDA